MVFLNALLKYKKHIALALCSFVLVPPLLRAQTLTLHAEHYPPYSIDNKKDVSTTTDPNISDTYSSFEGLDIELIKKAYSLVGVQVNFEFWPWKRVMRDVELGNILGGISCRKTKSREEFSDFSDPVSESRQALISRKSFKGEVSQNIENLKFSKVVIVSGYSQQSILDSRGIEYTKASSLTQGLNLVKHRDQDVFFSGWEGAAYEAKRLGYLDELVFTQANTGGIKEYRVCFSKKYENSEKWRLMLNEGLKKMREQGLMKPIQQKYGITN